MLALSPVPVVPLTPWVQPELGAIMKISIDLEDTEPLFAWFLRNCLFWFGTLCICNLSVFGFIFNRPTLYNQRGKKKESMNCIKAKVEKYIFAESCLRFFFGFL